MKVSMDDARHISKRPSRGRVVFVVALALSAACSPVDPDLQIDQPYRRVLLSNPVLRDAGGGIVVTRVTGRPLLIGVGHAVIPAGQSLDKCGLQMNEARFEALTAAASANAPLRIVSERSSGDFITTTVVDGEERSEILEKTTRVAKIQFEAMVKGLRPVGRWRGKVGDKDAVFVALGTEISEATFGDSNR
jgi:hypothetical protein